MKDVRGMTQLTVSLGERSYPIHIGSDVLDAPELYRPHIQGGRAAVVTNDVVAPLYLARLRSALAAAGVACVEIVLPDGEGNKDWQTLDRIADGLLAGRCDRRTPIVALGGGVIGDMAGFAAAIYQRGVPFIQVPTTLLAQVDSSVGGKTAINHVRGKNMLGAFHQPRAVITDVGTLGTLPERELKAGLAEVIKHGLILDAEFVTWLEASMERILARDAQALVHAIRRCCELKAEVVRTDEREEGLRAILNFGHTFGHAIETAMGYGSWLHGEAVAAGMVIAARLSVEAGLLARADAERVRRLIERAGLPADGPPLAYERYMELMAVDKKAERGSIRFVLLEGIGAARVAADLSEAQLRRALGQP